MDSQPAAIKELVSIRFWKENNLLPGLVTIMSCQEV